MFVQMIFSEPQNILLPNLVLLCSIISQSVMQKNWFTLFNVKVTARAYKSYDQNMTVKSSGLKAPTNSKLLVSLQPNLV